MTNSDQVATLTARQPIPALAYLLTGCIAVIGSNSLVLGPIAPAVAASFATSVPAVMIASAAIAPPGRESGTIGVVLTGWTLSMVAGVSLSAVLADLLHWRAVFAAVAVLAALALTGLTLTSLSDVRKS